MAALSEAQPGDRIVTSRADGLFDVENVSAPGQLEVARTGLKTLNEAHQIARTGGKLWRRYHSSPDTIEPF